MLINKLYVALHTGNPEENNQQNNEATYLEYNRIPISKYLDRFILFDIKFPECKKEGFENIITHVSVDYSQTGESKIFAAGELFIERTICAGIIPIFLAGELKLNSI